MEGIGLEKLLMVLGAMCTTGGMVARWIILKWFEREDRRDAEKAAADASLIARYERENATLAETTGVQAAEITKLRGTISELYSQISDLRVALARSGADHAEGQDAQGG